MMGERTAMQGGLLYNFSLEQHVPTDHLLRSTTVASSCAMKEPMAATQTTFQTPGASRSA
jgi:hypothetical protein